ncbi:DnaJ-like protein subfamily C member 11 [Lamellibrachia satsuma]|nr:DnaJ-like protein subfamily C member 11 [Lamellibrachia satsuma]
MAASMEGDDNLIDSDDYYAWLGLSKDASKDEINNAFRRLSRMYHPDKHTGNPELTEKAGVLFTRVKQAYEVLSDEHKRAIYDTTGIKGLETEGWELVSRTKTPQEILEEYERLSKEREERRLQQRTNPRGTVTVGVDATDLFDSYVPADATQYSSSIPHLEINQMSINQSIECPLTTNDTATLSGSLSTHNGRGHGNVSGTFRRIISQKSWAEAELTTGNGTVLQIRGFRTLWRRGFSTLAGIFQFTPHGIRPGLSATVATQLDKNLQGRLMWNAGFQSSINTMAIWDTEKHHLTWAVQLGFNSSFMMLNYTRKFVENDAKFRSSLRFGTFGVVLEYGCEKKVSQFSVLGATMTVGTPMGVSLKIRLNRGSQTYIFPIHLSETIVPSAVFYGTVVPIGVYFAVKILLVNPFMKGQKERELQKKKEVNQERLAEKKRLAETAVELMQATVDRSYEVESRKGGLVVKKALYGKLEGEQVRDSESINVTRPLQAVVHDSKLFIAEDTDMSELPGFYDPCVGEEKKLSVTYEFRRQLHICKYSNKQKVLLPNREHICEKEPS